MPPLRCLRNRNPDKIFALSVTERADGLNAQLDVIFGEVGAGLPQAAAGWSGVGEAVTAQHLPPGCGPAAGSPALTICGARSSALHIRQSPQRMSLRICYDEVMPVQVSFPMITPGEIRERFAPRLQEIDADQAILWGSYARGDAHPGSDVDLIVIVDTDLDRFGRYKKYTWNLVTALDGLLPDEPNRRTPRIDLDIFTPDEWQSHRICNSAVYELATSEGMVIYERPLQRVSV